MLLPAKSSRTARQVPHRAGSGHLTESAGMARGSRSIGIEQDSGRRTELVEWRAVSAWCQAVLAIQWLWRLSTLWVAVTSRHADGAAALSLRRNR